MRAPQTLILAGLMLTATFLLGGATANPAQQQAAALPACTTAVSTGAQVSCSFTCGPNASISAYGDGYYWMKCSDGRGTFCNGHTNLGLGGCGWGSSGYGFVSGTCYFRGTGFAQCST